MLSTIILPIDGTEPSQNALRPAVEFAQKFDARLILVHVLLRGTSVSAIRELAERNGFVGEIESDLSDVEIIPVATTAGVTAPIEFVADETIEKVAHLLLDKAKAETSGVERVETRVLEGDPADAILQCAQEEAADMIIIGSHGVGDLKSLLLGSVSHKVVENSTCPCLVVK